MAFAEQLASACADVLGDAIVAVILHGSLARGDFVPGRSDIDLLVIVAESLSEEQVAAVRSTLEQRAPARVDLRIVTRATAAAPTRSPALEAGFVLHPGEEPELEARAAEEPDLVVELWVARAHGRSLAGRPPDATIAPVPREWLIEVGDRQLAAWERLTGDAEHAEFMVLTACRIWRFAAEGVHCSKTAAGRWALARDPSLTAVDEALRQRTVDPSTRIRDDAIAHILARVRRELAAHRADG
jgi:predicted nucleotidyltransferase